MTKFIIIFFSAITLLIILSALLNKIPRKIGLRNVWRRKSNTILVIIGSMIATSLITSSLVLQDSMDKTFYNMVLENEGEIDARISFDEIESTPAPFTVVSNEDLSQISDALDREDVDGILTVFRLTTSPYLLSTAGEPELQAYNIRLTGLHPEEISTFGQDPPNITFDTNDLSQVIIGKSLADELDAQRGDTIGFTYFEEEFKLIIHDIAEPNGIIEDRGMLVQKKFITDALELPEKTAQQLFVSTTGGVRPEKYEGEKFENDLTEAIQNIELANITLKVEESKSEALDGYGMGNFVSILLGISIFGSLVGTLLIISLYSMLATARKTEMGIMRAIGMTRGDLVKAFVYEGFIYSLLASLVGMVAGIGIGSVLVNQFTSMFGSLFDTIQQGPSLDFQFHFTAKSLAIGASAGFLFTIITVILSSYAFSKINIVNAIRQLSEIKIYRWSLKTIFSLIWKALLLLAGAVSVFMANTIPDTLQSIRDQEGSPLHELTDTKFTEMSELYSGYAQFIGITIVIWISALILVQLIKIIKQKDWSRYIVRIAAVTSIGFNAFIQEFDAMEKAVQYDGGMALFFMSGGMLVISAAVLVAYSLGLIVRVIELAFRKFSSVTSVFRMGLRYPDANVVRTGITMVMFSLIIFLVVFISSIKASINNATEEMQVNALGGYTIDIVFGANASQDEINDTLLTVQNIPGVESAVASSDMAVELPDYADIEKTTMQGPPDPDDPDQQSGGADISFDESENNDVAKEKKMTSRLIALPIELLEIVDAPLLEKSPEYETNEDVWRALNEDTSKVALGTWFDEHKEDTLIDESSFPEFSIGNTITITDPSGTETVEKEIIAMFKYEGEGFGGINNQFVRRIIVGPNSIIETFDAEIVKAFAHQEILVRESSGTNRSDLIKQIKRDLLGTNIGFIWDIDVMLGAAFALINSIFLLLQGFLSLNLLIGSAGLAIIIARAVYERRQQIGMLRSLGFQQSMMLGVFFLESTFIAFLSIVIGVGMGLVSVNSFFKIFMNEEGVQLVYPVSEMTYIIIGVYVVAILLSLWPAYKASRLEPVEATNYPE